MGEFCWFSVKSWNTAGWFNLPLSIGNELAPLIGATEGEVAVTDSTSVNIFKAVAGALLMQKNQAVFAQPLTLETPREHAVRGSQVSIAHPHGYAVIQALIERGVIGDYREPHIMRFGFTPLYTSFSDVWHAVETLVDILDNKKYDISLVKNAVT